MAKVEMDISEYEALKETKRVLSDALDREQILNNTIDDLNKARIDALQKSSKKVVKEIITTKRAYTYKPMGRMGILNGLAEIFDLDRGRIYDRVRRHIDPCLLNDDLINLFFNKYETEKTEVDATLHGLSEIKAEIKAEYDSTVDTETKERLENEKVLSSICHDLNQKLSSSANKVSYLEEEVDNLKLALNEAYKALEMFRDDSKKVGYLAHMLTHSRYIFGKSKKIKEIENLIFKK